MNVQKIQSKEKSILDFIKIIGPTAPRITIYGEGGIGKSTLASKFPEPLFYLTEDCKVEGVRALGVVTDYKKFLEGIVDLTSMEELNFKTLIIDSISKLDELIVKALLEEETKSKNKPCVSLNAACGGYGAGFQAAQQEHRYVKSILDKLQKRGITVIYIGHLATVKYKAPDLEDYDRYTITMNHDKSREPYINDVDAVLFCKNRSYISTTDSGRNIASSTEDRIILTGVCAANVSKNRFNMPMEIDMSFDEIKRHIPFYNLSEEKS